MKVLLLLTAIYSLIIHQSNKNAKEKITAGNKPLINSITSGTNSYKRQITSPGFINVKTDYMSVNSNGSIGNSLYVNWENKE
jgi:hypothetical protein